MLKEALASMETALKQISDVNSALDEALIVAVTDQRGTILFANQKFCEISKYSREELLGQNHRIINSGHHSIEFFRDMWKTIANGKIWRGELRNRAKDGTIYWMDTTIVPLLNNEGKPYQYVSFRIDITDRKKTEELLRRSDKIAALGELASGLAHEIRNPLAAIKMSLQALDDNKVKAHPTLDLILAELDRIDEIVGEFMLLSKPHEMQFFEYKLRDMIEMVITLLKIQARNRKIDLSLEYDNSIPLIRCEINQLKQVLINLIKNSMEAMPDGGQITVRVDRPEESSARIRIIDNGCGIPDEVMSQVGEPFFTTKPTGTGLGLSITQKIIQDHGGRMEIHSKVNEGTRVDIFLPIPHDK